MEVPGLISNEVMEAVRIAISKQENWIAFSNTLMFIHKDELRFFTNKESADDYALDNHSDLDRMKVTRVSSVAEFIHKVESEMQGIIHTPDPDANGLLAGEPNLFSEMLMDHFESQQSFKNKTKTMNEKQMKNYESLKTKLQFLGFDKGLSEQLKEKMMEGKESFSLHASTEFGGDKMEAVINFNRSEKEGKENYFCNNYVATLKGEQDRSQFIYVNFQGQSFTFKESANLLNGRSVFKEFTPKDGEPFKAWNLINPDVIDPKTNYPKIKTFGYDFEVREALGRLPFKELSDPDQHKKLIASIEKGNVPYATLMKGGAEQRVYLEANPMSRTLNMYDNNGNKMDFPLEKVALGYGQAPVDQKKSEKKEEPAMAEEQLAYKKRDVAQKNGNGLLDKKSSRKSNSQKIS